MPDKIDLKPQEPTVSVKILGVIEASASGRVGIGALLLILLTLAATKLWT